MKIKHFFTLIFAFFFFSAFSQSQAIHGKTVFKAHVFTTRGVRTHANIPRGTPVTIVDKTDDFYKVILGDTTAYVSIGDVLVEKDKSKKLTRNLENNNVGRAKIMSPDKNTGTDFVNVANLSEPEKNKLEIDYIRHCSLKYRNEMMSGYLCQAMGGLCVVLGSTKEFSSDESSANALFFIGAGLSVSGIIMIADANKWMKRIYIGPNGVGIKYRF